jgi:hypothetical protein
MDAAVGVDGMTKERYGQDLEERLGDLHARLRSKRYRHQPIRRVHIPKGQGKTRPRMLCARRLLGTSVPIPPLITNQPVLPVSPFENVPLGGLWEVSRNRFFAERAGCGRLSLLGQNRV